MQGLQKKKKIYVKYQSSFPEWRTSKIRFTSTLIFFHVCKHVYNLWKSVKKINFFGLNAAGKNRCLAQTLALVKPVLRTQVSNRAVQTTAWLTARLGLMDDCIVSSFFDDLNWTAKFTWREKGEIHFKFRLMPIFHISTHCGYCSFSPKRLSTFNEVDLRDYCFFSFALLCIFLWQQR